METAHENQKTYYEVHTGDEWAEALGDYATIDGGLEQFKEMWQKSLDVIAQGAESVSYRLDGITQLSFVDVWDDEWTAAELPSDLSGNPINPTYRAILVVRENSMSLEFGPKYEAEYYISFSAPEEWVKEVIG